MFYICCTFFICLHCYSSTLLRRFPTVCVRFQFERAADMYPRLKQPITSSRCYKQLGNFNKTIEVLYENESYNMALDTLRRYQMILQVGTVGRAGAQCFNLN